MPALQPINQLLAQADSLSLVGKSAAAAIGILIIWGAFHVLERTLPRHFRQGDARYRVRKFIVFCSYVTILLFLAILFEDRLGRLSFALGIAGAGLAVALQDIIASIAGAFSIGFSSLYAVGDRVQIGDTRGDVIDIGLLRTTIMETGNWVNADLYNGRIVRVPNSSVLKGTVFNYSQGFRFIWDEIKVVLSTDSDCSLARNIFLRLAKEAVGDYLLEAQTSWKVISDNYQSANPALEPSVSLIVNAGSLEFSISYVVDYNRRTAMKDRLFTRIIEEIAQSNGKLQWSSTVTTVVVNQSPSQGLTPALQGTPPQSAALPSHTVAPPVLPSPKSKASASP
jgi:small-conductance mechanosensitive channel